MNKEKKTLLIAVMALTTAANVASARGNIDPVQDDECELELLLGNMDYETINLRTRAFAEYDECPNGVVTVNGQMHNSQLITDDKEYEIKVHEMYNSLIKSYGGNDKISVGTGRKLGSMVDSVIFTHHGDDKIDLVNVKACTVNAEDGDDEVYIAGKIYDLELNMGRGDDRVVWKSDLPLKGENQIETTVIDMGPGIDQLQLKGSQDDYEIKKSDDEIYIFHKLTRIRGLIVLKNCEKITFWQAYRP